MVKLSSVLLSNGRVHQRTTPSSKCSRIGREVALMASEAVVKMASKIIVGGVVATEVVAAPVVDSKWVRSERRLTWPFRIS